MKRKLSLIGAAIMVLLIVYSGVAWWMLRGAGAYRIGTQLGEVLSVSWQYTALAALLLLLILGIPFMLHRIRKSKAAKLPDAQKNLHRKGKESGAETEIQVVMQTQRDTEKLQPRRGAHTSSKDETALLHDSATTGDETVLLRDSISDSSDETVPLRDGAASPGDETTVFLPGEITATENGTVLPQAGSINPEKVRTNNALPADNFCCPKCGAAASASQKFCTRCGCVLRGGGV